MASRVYLKPGYFLFFVVPVFSQRTSGRWDKTLPALAHQGAFRINTSFEIFLIFYYDLTKRIFGADLNKLHSFTHDIAYQLSTFKYQNYRLETTERLENKKLGFRGELFFR